jgi:uncharacterized protein (TIGR02722 family)
MKTVKLILIIIIIGLCSCGPTRNVTRTNSETITDLSGRWNDTDSRLTAEKMISSLLNSNWISIFESQNNRKPVIIIGNILNRTSEHIQTITFIKDVERELVNSGMVTFVASKTERQGIREERIDQQRYSSIESARKLAEETGADLILAGIITSQVDAIEGISARYYQVNLELINLETNEKVWMGTKKIKKIIEQDEFKW